MRHRIATYSIGGRVPYDFPTLPEVIAAGALTKLAEDAARRSPDHPPPYLEPGDVIEVEAEGSASCTTAWMRRYD